MTSYQLQLAFPLFAMALLSFIVVFSLGISRFRAASQKRLEVKYYKLFRGEGEPDEIRQISRNFQNLFEAPVLFFVVILLALLLQVQSVIFLYFAWTYVVLRYLHSYVHCTSNRIKIRFRLYILSSLVLLGLWIVLFIKTI